MIVVTGGAGMIGSAVVWELNRKGESDILIVDNLGTEDKWKNIAGLRFNDYMHRDDFIERLRTGQWQHNIKSVIHMGACSSTTEKDAEFLMVNNYQYSRDLCWGTLRQKARFINASSAATYGDGSQGFEDGTEKLDKYKALNMYALSKQLFDNWAVQTNAIRDIASLKFFNVYGPNEYHKGNMMSVVCKAVPQIKESGKLRLFKSDRPDYADGGQMRDFVYVKDCAALIVWLLENPQVNGIMNVGNGKARTWNDLAKAVFTALDMPENIEYIDMPDNLKGKYQYFTQAEMGWLEKAQCPVKLRSLEEGVDDYVRNYLTQDDPYLSSK